ncbi:MAG TPA: DUF1223 domain-containing protein [Opitutaceae bacterium]|nr:DUF1223 domain-containing protein [Opitutaceae bacterium]
MFLPGLRLLAAALLLSTALAAEPAFSSGPGRVALIELYTSEGCSSCPPADRWLGDLRDAAGLWQRFVPVAFHVNYWDRLGWRDALARADFTQRQYAYADAWHAPSVYTPCFVRNGAEWQPRDPADAKPDAAGSLSLARQPDGAWRVDYTPPAARRAERCDVFVALLGGGIVSSIHAGENSGRELHHEFVALDLASSALTPSADGHLGAILPSLNSHAAGQPAASRHAIAAWIVRHGELAPLQATGGWLDTSR